MAPDQHAGDIAAESRQRNPQRAVGLQRQRTMTTCPGVVVLELFFSAHAFRHENASLSALRNINNPCRCHDIGDFEGRFPPTFSASSGDQVT